MDKKHYEVVAAIIYKDGKIFCCQRGNKGECALKWEFPGGKIEPGESKEEAIVREIKEELNSLIRVNEYIGTVNNEYNTFNITMHCFKCSLIEGNLNISEHINSTWISIDEIKDYSKLDWAAADIKVIDLINEL